MTTAGETEKARLCEARLLGETMKTIRLPTLTESSSLADHLVVDTLGLCLKLRSMAR